MTMIEKLERADGPDRGLDRAIAKMIGWHRVEPRFTRSKHGAWISPDDWIGENSNGSPILDGLRRTTMYREVPSYTASIDTAMTLVPEGLMWSVQTDFGLPGRARLWGSVLPSQAAARSWNTDGATPAIALCIAALRARSQGGE